MQIVIPPSLALLPLRKLPYSEICYQTFAVKCTSIEFLSLVVFSYFSDCLKAVSSATVAPSMRSYTEKLIIIKCYTKIKAYYTLFIHILVSVSKR